MWEISMADQLLSISVSLIYGAILCLSYDVIRAVRRVSKPSDFSVAVWDVLFFSISGVGFFLVCLARSCGEIRGYILISVIIGFFLCRATFSLVIFKVAVFLVGLLYKSAVFLTDKIARFCGIVTRYLTKILNKLHNVLKAPKKCLKNGKGVLYNK